MYFLRTERKPACNTADFFGWRGKPHPTRPGFVAVEMTGRRAADGTWEIVTKFSRVDGAE